MSLYSSYWTEPSNFIGAAVGLSVLDIASTAARFLARVKQRQPLKADDWLMIPAAACTVGIGICMIYGVSQRALAYSFEMPQDPNINVLESATLQISIEGQLQWAYIIQLSLALGCTKASFLLFYKRIFAINPSGRTNLILVSLVVLVFMWTIAFFFASVFECNTKFWAIWTSPNAFLENCVNDLQLALGFAASDLILDCVILIIPIPLVWRLNLNLPKKLAITSVFLLALGTVAASVARVVMTTKVVAEGYDENIDPILLVSSFIYWGMVESGIAVFVVSLPTLWFFIKRSSWDPIVRVVRSIASSSITSIRQLRTRQSRSRLEGEEVSLDTYTKAVGGAWSESGRLSIRSEQSLGTAEGISQIPHR
jgi:hypothetical protein